jgi:ribonuclease P protein component
MAGEEFPAQLRLRQRREFLAVQRLGTKYHTRNFLVFVQVDERPGPTRLGVTVTKKVGNAVQRNWIKRRVREAFRRKQRAFAPGLSMVWIAKKQAKGVTFAEVQADFETLLSRRGLRREPGLTVEGVTKGAERED